MACDKIEYNTYADAKDHAHGLRVRKGTKKSNFRIYKCADCDKFHVTTVYKNKKEKAIKDEKYKFKLEEYRPMVIKVKNHKPSDEKKEKVKPKVEYSKIISPQQAAFLKSIIANNKQP